MQILQVARSFRRCFHLGRIVPEIDPKLSEQLENEEVRAKRLPSRRRLGLRRLPAQLEMAAQSRIEAYGDRIFRQEAFQLMSVLYDLKLPDDKGTLEQKSKDIQTTIEMREKTPRGAIYDPTEFFFSEEQDLGRYELKRLIHGSLEERRRDWHYYEYDEFASNLYMAVRLPANYSVLKSVMEEIRAADPSFSPNSVLDFGSGMGTTIWAVNNTWPDQVSEFLNIEISKEQQHLCEFLLRRGKHSSEQLPGIFHKEYLPISTKTKYDLVVAAFSLLELPNAESRAHFIENLWNKTNDLLVIVERGNTGGFATVNEARHQILDLSGRKVTSKINKTFQTKPKPDITMPKAHVVAPCAHDFHCPRISMPSKLRLNECRFRVAFEPLEIKGPRQRGFQEEFSYVVLRKRPYTTNYYHHPEHLALRWPRIVERRKKGSRQLQFNLCTPQGCLAEAVITRRYGKPSFEIAKSCNWGDVLPIKVCDNYVKKSSTFLKNEDGDKEETSTK